MLLCLSIKVNNSNRPGPSNLSPFRLIQTRTLSCQLELSAGMTEIVALVDRITAILDALEHQLQVSCLARPSATKLAFALSVVQTRGVAIARLARHFWGRAIAWAPPWPLGRLILMEWNKMEQNGTEEKDVFHDMPHFSSIPHHMDWVEVQTISSPIDGWPDSRCFAAERSPAIDVTCDGVVSRFGPTDAHELLHIFLSPMQISAGQQRNTSCRTYFRGRAG